MKIRWINQFSSSGERGKLELAPSAEANALAISAEVAEHSWVRFMDAQLQRGK